MSVPPKGSEAGASKPFEFGCSCGNAYITGQIASTTNIPSTSDEVKAGSSEYKVWLGEDSEEVRQAQYVTWDQEDSRPSRRKTPAPDEEDEESDSEPSWRKCWVCDVRLYKVTGKQTADEGVTEDWVTIDLASGILWGDKLRDSVESDRLPFTSLRLDVHPYISKFGKPPPSPLTVYRPPRRLSSRDDEDAKYIRPPQDPFFLPPPFIPSHPHLRELCTRAVDFLRERHSIKEYQIQHFIAQQEQEMRDLEDTVRNEVEALWNRYIHVPGVAQELDRSRSRSKTREGEKDKRRQSVSKFSPSPAGDVTPTRAPIANPIRAAQVSSSPPVGGSSLLSASITANSFHAPPPPPRVSDKVDDSITELSKMTDKNSDARAVAMSHVFSVLDENMAARSGKRKVVPPTREELKMQQKEMQLLDQQYDEIKEEEDRNGKDSWIDQEEKTLGVVATGDEGDGRTPRPARRQELAEIKAEGKEKRAVKFAEDGPPQGSPSKVDQDQDEYVFDFELEDEDKKVPSGQAKSGSPPKRDVSRFRNMFEESLSKTYAADAPSHRRGWKMAVQDGSLYAPMRRTSTDSLGGDSDESSISKLAMSMPMEIALKTQRKPSVLPAMERKTSWSDRPEFVPPLLGAMRQRGIGQQNSLGLSPARPSRGEMPRKTSRSASVSRERETARTYSQDPGAVFESMADGAEDDEDGEEQEGTFVPPHVIARRASQDGGPEVGWRSLAPT